MEENEIHSEPKKMSVWTFVKRFTIITILLSVLVLGTSVALVFIYEKDVKALIIKELNKQLNAEVIINPDNIDLTIIKSFPNCALEFKNFAILEVSKNKQKDTLLTAQSLSLGFNLKDLYYKKYNIKYVALIHAAANLKVDKKGNPNYIIWKTINDTSSVNDSLHFKLEDLLFTDIHIKYKNAYKKIKFNGTIETLNFKGSFSDEQYDLSTNGKTFIDLLKIENATYLQKKNLRFDLILAVNNHHYTIKKSETHINKTTIVSEGDFIFKDSLQSLDLNFNGKNLDIASTISILPEKFQTHLNDYDSEGEFYAHGNCHYKASKPLILLSEFGIKNATITYKPKNTTLSHVNLSGKIDVQQKTSALFIYNASASLNTNTFNGDALITNFNDPYLKLNLQANTNLQDLINFYPIDTLQELSGNIDAKASIEGLVIDMKANAFNPTIKANGNASLKNIKAKFKQSEKEINIPEGEVVLTDRNLQVTNLQLIKGNSDVSLVGELPNFLGYLFNPEEPLTINAALTSNNIEVEDFIYSSSASSNQESSSVSIKNNLDLNITTSIKKLSFGKFSATDISGKLLLKNQKIAIQNLSLLAADGTVKLNAVADASSKNIVITGNADMQKLNIQKLFVELNNFGQTTLEDKHLKGFITTTTDFSATWNNQLAIDLNSIQATSNILIERGELNNFKPLESLAKYIDVNELQHIKFSTLQSAIEIKNKLITIPKTSIKSSALNLELYGSHSFDNIIDYHIQLLMSELLAKRNAKNKDLDDELTLVEHDSENRRSVFFVMTGPIDNPTIKYDRKGAKQKIKEDIQQEKQTIKQLLKEEFGLFKRDSIKTKAIEKSNQKFTIDFGDKKPTEKKPSLTPKKKADEDDDF